MKGHRLLAEVNIVRAVLGMPPLGRIKIVGHVRNCGQCTIRHAAGCGAASGVDPAWTRSLTLKFFDEKATRDAGGALGRPFNETSCEVLAPDAISSLDIATHFGLVFVDPEGYLRGWIEPSDADPHVWDLHLMPGQDYPPGHAPHGYHTAYV